MGQSLELSCTWEEKYIDTASFTGGKLLSDAITVHNIICRNIAGSYDAYTWINPCLNDKNGRLDMVVLRGNFSSEVADQVLGGQSNVKFDKLFYRSEHQIIFEALVTKFTNTINEKERSGRIVSDLEIFDATWEKFQ